MPRGPNREDVRRASPIQDVITALTGHPVQGSGTERLTRCPFHEDNEPSLRINVEKQTYFCDPCHGGGDVFRLVEQIRGCDFPAALAFLAERAGLNGQGETREPEAIYPYHDEQGVLLFEVVRFPSKQFRQRRPDGAGGWIWRLDRTRRVLFGLPELRGQRVVYIVEGEKDVLALRAIGLTATCNAGGAGKWHDAHAQQLQAAGIESVVVLPDHDDAGHPHAETAARSCDGAGLKVKLVELPDLPPKGDVSDWLAAGHTREDLVALVKATSLYEPPAHASEAAPSAEPAAESASRLPTRAPLNTLLEHAGLDKLTSSSPAEAVRDALESTQGGNRGRSTRRDRSRDSQQAGARYTRRTENQEYSSPCTSGAR